MTRKKLLKWFAMFFVVMLLFTFLSRAADSVNVARISTKTVQNQIITHTVKGMGKVEGTKEFAVFTVEGQRVSQVFVQEGQAVKAGDELFRISMESLEEAIKEKSDAVEELTLQVNDIQSQGSVDHKKKSYEQSRAQENYNVAVGNGDINIASAQNELNIARQRLQDYYEAQSFTDGMEDTSQEDALKDNIRAREEALNQAIIARNQEVLAASREIQDANIADASDGSLQNAQRNLENAQEKLQKLQELQQMQGSVKAAADGVVKSVSAVTGGLTSQEAAMVLYETGGTFRMTGTVSEDDVKYLEVGGAVKVTGSDGKTIDNAVLESIREDETDSTLRILSIQIPENTISIGESAEFSISKEEGPYNSCIPLSALHEANGEKFVYVLDTQNTVLGEVMVARKFSVEVKDRNETLAAVQDGYLSTSQKVIIDADREISDGSRVRLQES